MDRIKFETLIEMGASQREIGRVLKVSQSTVKWWLKKFGLKTKLAISIDVNGAVYASSAESRRVTAWCKRHGKGLFIRKRKGNFRCKKCDWMENYKRRTENRAILIAEHGGKCVKCGFPNPVALEFHHTDKKLKKFSIGVRAFRSLLKLREEAKKCDLLCANCHRIVEDEERKNKLSTGA